LFQGPENSGPVFVLKSILKLVFQYLNMLPTGTEVPQRLQTMGTKKMVNNTTLNKPRCTDYHNELIKSLKDRKHAVAYLNAALGESLKGDAESQTLFLKAIKNVAEAQRHGQ
jgi:hypothetical protein